MNKRNKTKAVFEVVLVIGGILLIPLFFVVRSGANNPSVSNTDTEAPLAAIPSDDNSDTNSVVIAKQQPPTCTFPLAQTTTEEAVPKEYVFSEPQVVMTSRYQADIIEWLPDNQNVLIMPVDDHLFDGIDGRLQTIELFNPETQEIQIYATRRDFGDTGLPIWNPALKAVVYPVPNILGENKASKQFKIDRQIRISQGDPDDTQLLADNLPQYYVTVKSDGSQIAYFTDKQLIKLDTSLNAVAPIPFDRKSLDFKRNNSEDVNVIYKMAWRPNSSQIFVYNWAPDNLGYTYILDADTGQLCSLDFGGWAFVSHWSPNGRYLAIVRAQGLVPVQSSDLAVLDTATGNFYTLELPDEIEGRRYVKDFAWAPDNRHLFIMGGNYGHDNNIFNGMLFLGDFISGQFDHILSSHIFTAIWAESNLAWTYDGEKLLMNCPVLGESSQICLVSVQVSDQ